MKKIALVPVTQPSRLSVVSLFSGCGGMDLGAHQAGCEIIYANDISKVAVESLRKLLPDVEAFIGRCADIKSFPQADIVCGGYPCQSFSMGGVRSPKSDVRTSLYLDFVAAVDRIRPRFFVVENVPGLISLDEGRQFKKQLSALRAVGIGYRISWKKINAAEYGVPQKRHRVIIVGVRRDLEAKFTFPAPTHGVGDGLLPFVGQGEVLAGFDSWPIGEFYTRPGGQDENFPWYFMSRNRRASVGGPSFTIVANWRHTPLHPASPLMSLTWSNLADGWKQRWDFTDEYEDGLERFGLVPLAAARRLSWRECAVLQSFPRAFEPAGDVQAKFEQIGNAVPPLLSKKIFSAIVDGSGLVPCGKKKLEILSACTNEEWMHGP